MVFPERDSEDSFGCCIEGSAQALIQSIPLPRWHVRLDFVPVCFKCDLSYGFFNDRVIAQRFVCLSSWLNQIFIHQ
jgi:hypothetical protein